MAVYPGLEPLEFNVVIAEGASVSAAIKTGGLRPLMVICPAEWTAAKLQFQTSRDGTTWTGPALITAGTKLELGAAASAPLVCPTEYPVYRQYIRLFSCDTNSAAVVQAAARTLTVVMGK